MDQGTRTGGPALGGHKRGPDEIREDIEQTREELGETVEALAAKTDVRAQARAKVEDTKQRVSAKVDDLKAKVSSHENAGTQPGTGDDGAAARVARERAQQLKVAAAENPVAVRMIGVFVAGVVIGVMLARRR